MPTTRRQRQKQTSDLILEPQVLVHIISAIQTHSPTWEGKLHLLAASRVCRCWHESVQGRAQIEDEPDNAIGELRSGDKPYRFDRPHDVIFLPGGDVCVADCDNFRLQILSREGTYMREIRLSGGTSCPTGVVSCGEYLYVVEHGSHQLSKLRRASSSGHRHALAGGWGSGDGELRHPWGVANAGRHLFVSDQGNDRVCVFDDKLKWLFNFGERGSGNGQLREPRGVAADESRAELFVADYRNHRIVVYTLSKAADHFCPHVRTIGGGASAIEGRFNLPSGVCIQGAKLLVAEMGGERVQLVTMDGLFLQAVQACGPCSGICADAEHVCVTTVDGGHALTMWRTLESSRRSSGGSVGTLHFGTPL